MTRQEARNRLDAIPRHLRTTFFALAMYANADGLAWPSVDTLAHDTGRDPRTIRRYLGALEKLGEISAPATGRAGGRSRATVWQIRKAGAVSAFTVRKAGAVSRKADNMQLNTDTTPPLTTGYAEKELKDIEGTATDPDSESESVALATDEDAAESARIAELKAGVAAARAGLTRPGRPPV